MKKIITYGTFDLFHIGHLNLLKRAKELWNYLIVWISTDEFNSLKWKNSFFSYEERKQIVESMKYVDEVIPEENWEQKVKDIKKYDIDIFVIWDDWKWKFDYLKDYWIEVIYLSRTKWISSTQIKWDIKKISNNAIEQVEKGLEALKELKKIL